LPNAPALSTTSTDSKNAAAPVAGANSFTETEARNRLQTHGYTDVAALVKDDQSIWRSKAMKDGKSVNAALDFQGNIAAFFFVPPMTFESIRTTATHPLFRSK
jgi:hypothetical protein